MAGPNEIKEIMLWGVKGALSGSLAVLLTQAARPVVLADYDQGKPWIASPGDSSSCRAEEIYGNLAWIDVRKCIHCGTCEVRCPSAAIHNLKVNLQECQGCEQCLDLCAVEAIRLCRNVRINWEICRHAAGIMIRAPANPFPDITAALIKQESLKYTHLLQGDFFISRGPSILDETLYTILDRIKLVLAAIDLPVTDIPALQRILRICQQFQIPTAAFLIDSGKAIPDQIERLWAESDIPIISRLRMDEISGARLNQLWQEIKRRAL